MAVCDTYKQFQEVTFEYPKGTEDSSTGGPVRMIACHNPDKLQYMYGIVGSDKTPPKIESMTYEVNNYECQTIRCTNTSLRIKDDINWIC